MLLFLACATPLPAEPEPVLGEAMDGIPSLSLVVGGWQVESVSGRARLSGPAEIDLGADVSPEFTFNADGSAVVFPQGGASPLPDLFRVSLPSGERTRLTDWPGSEDRPVFSPDGGRVAFFGDRTGLASLYVLDLSTGEVEQVTNVGLEAKRRMGGPPEGFVHPPFSSLPTWDERGVHYQSAEGPVSVVVP